MLGVPPVAGEEADMNPDQFEEHFVRVRSLRDALAPMLTCAQDLALLWHFGYYGFCEEHLTHWVVSHPVV